VARLKPPAWPPAITLAVGAVLATVGVQAQRTLPLRVPLAASVPASFEGYQSRDIILSAEERAVAGVSAYLARVYSPADTSGSLARYFTVYVGYYERQVRGKTIHSPKNCLPGEGWEPLTSDVATLQAPSGPLPVNRYLIQKGQNQALVLYWYQGRGRIVANEYRVKWNLLEDAALRRRSDEALVRVVVPIRTRGSEAVAFAQASRIAERMVASVAAALPEG
jgi:EpsI family protein